VGEARGDAEDENKEWVDERADEESSEENVEGAGNCVLAGIRVSFPSRTGAFSSKKESPLV
jgi:hypothetical protein